MDFILFFLLALYISGFSLCILFSVKNYLAIFQMNSYDTRKFIKHIKKNILSIIIKSILFISIIPINFFLGKIGLTVSGIFFIIIAYTHRRKKLSEPLIYSMSVIRILIIIAVISGFVLVFSFVPYVANYNQQTALPLACTSVIYYVLSPCLVIIANQINKFIENTLKAMKS